MNLQFNALVGFLFLIIIPSEAQYFLHGKVIEKGSKEPLAFVHIRSASGENHTFSDIEGSFIIKSYLPIDTLIFHKPLHQSDTVINLNDFSGNLRVKLEKTDNFEFVRKTSPQAKVLIEKVLSNKEKNNPERLHNYTCQTYNKLTLTSGKVEEIDKKIFKFLEKFKITNSALKHFKHDHHLLLMESVTERDFLDELNQEEIIVASKVSGIEKPTFFTTISQFQPFSIYQNHLTLAGSSYYSPLIPKALKWHHFEIVDSAFIKQDTLYVVQYNPWWERRIEFTKGYMAINTSKYNITHLWITPSIDKNVETEFSQSYQIISDSVWFPHKTKTAILKDRYAKSSSKVDVITRTTIFDVKLKDSLFNKKFDDIIIDFKDSTKYDETYWTANRKDEFSLKDMLTYTFYDSVGSIKNFERLIHFGESLYYGELPLKYLDLDIHKVLKINEFEGLRLGLALRTSDKVSKHFNLGGYYSYGFKDKQRKYGGEFRLFLSKKSQTTLTASYHNDIAEAGKINFFFDKHQFSKEGLRDVLVTVMDKVERSTVSLETHPFKYLSLKTAIVQSKEIPLYTYRFADNENSVFQYGEFQFGLKFAYGEHFMRLPNGKLPFDTKYPTLWLQFNRGYKNWLNGEFDYTKLDFKLEHSIKFIGFGTSSFQLALGFTEGDVPYSKLFNGRGAHKPFSAVVHNSFETMSYNEFLSDRYAALFFSHNFGRMHIRKGRQQPYVVFIHNVGWGTLQNAALHKDFGFKTMENIYVESGLFLDNIFVIKGLGFKVGLGAGVFGRYGYYAFQNKSDNIVGKIAINFQL